MAVAENKRYERALAFATHKHEGQYRIGGQPYITHPIEVAHMVREKGYGIDYQITALFHDLLEDTDATEDEIEELGGTNVREAVVLLTKKEGYVMEKYVSAIKANKIAFPVKAADRLHNLRSADCTDEEFKRKYIIETVQWYLDFCPEIGKEVRRLAGLLKEPLNNIAFLYESK